MPGKVFTVSFLLVLALLLGGAFYLGGTAPAATRTPFEQVLPNAAPHL